MSEKMLITQALDERDLLVKKINDKIEKADFIDTIKVNEEKVLDKRVTKEEFSQQAESAYQQIMDLITRFQKVDAAITASNADTTINTTYGDFTVSEAIAMRGRMRTCNSYGGDADFENSLRNKMQRDYEKYVQQCDIKNRQLQSTAENMRLSILGKDSKAKDDKPLEVVDAYVRENTTEMVDPLDVKNKIAALDEKRMTLLKELDTAIKVSNATTFIEIE